MPTMNHRSVSTPLPAGLGSVVEEALNRIADQIAHDPEGHEFLDILTVEEWTDELMRRLGQGIMGRFIEVRSRQARQTPMKCTQCGQAMQIHKRSAWSRQTLWGEVRVDDDAYFYCRDCGTSARPLHNFLGTERETWSLLVQEAAVDLATDESCQKAVEKLAKHHRGVQMNRTTALRLLHLHGASAREFVAQKLRVALMKAADQSRRRRAGSRV